LAWSTQGGGSTASLLSCPAPLADPASPFSSCAHSISQWGQAEQDATRWCEVTSACVCVLAHVCSRAPYQSCCLCLWHPLPWVRPPLWTLGSSAWGRVGLVSGWCQGGVCDYWSQTRPDHFPWLWPWTLTFATVRGV
jgi:hypothetical protein